MDIYTEDGIMVSHYPNEDGSTILITEFLFEKPDVARLFRLAAGYHAFIVNTSTDFVLMDFYGRRLALMADALTPAVRDTYVQSLIRAREKGNSLYFLAMEEFFGKTSKETVQTNRLPLLVQYKNCEMHFTSFFEKCSRMLSPQKA